MWAAVLITAAGCYLLELLGLSVPERVLDSAAVQRISDLIPVVLLAALVAVQVVADENRLAADARLTGLAVAAVALVLRLPFLAVVVLAAASAATTRLL
jgi:branched-subunit amino acid transport protein